MAGSRVASLPMARKMLTMSKGEVPIGVAVMPQQDMLLRASAELALMNAVHGDRASCTSSNIAKDSCMPSIKKLFPAMSVGACMLGDEAFPGEDDERGGRDRVSVAVRALICDGII